MDHMSKPVDLPAPCGLWVWGPPGVGKSHWVREQYPNAFFKPQNKWWDGYQGEKFVILDDFDCTALGHLLKIWADKYSFVAETKGYSTHIRPFKFIITSNYSIEALFQQDNPMMLALLRRFFVIEIKERRF